MKACCTKNIPTYRPKPMYCKDCGTKFEPNTQPLSLKRLADIPVLFTIHKQDLCVSYSKLTVKPFRKENNNIIVPVREERVILNLRPNKVSAEVYACFKTSYAISIDSLTNRYPTEPERKAYLISVIKGSDKDSTEEEYEIAKAKALAIMTFAKSNA